MNSTAKGRTNPTMKLVPAEATDEMARHLRFSLGVQQYRATGNANWPAVLAAAPHAGQVSREQVKKAVKVCWEEGYVASLQSLGLQVEEE